MKKLISILSLVMVLIMLTACGKFTCESCQQEKSGSKHKVTVMNQSATICDDCYDKLKSLNIVD